MTLAVQAIIGTAGSSSTGQNASPNATGAAVASGNWIAGAALYFNTGTPGTDNITSVVDNLGASFTLLPAVVDSGGLRYMRPFTRFNITTGPTALHSTYTTNNATSSQVIWAEFPSKLTSGSVFNNTGQSQPTPGTTIDAITSGAVGCSGPVIGIGMNRQGVLTVVPGTGYTLEAQDSSSANWGGMLVSRIGTLGTLGATFTDPTNGSASGQIYNTAVIAVAGPLLCTGQLLGVGCSIGWRASLLAGAAWRASKAIERNDVITRRRLLIGHNGGPPLDD